MTNYKGPEEQRYPKIEALQNGIETSNLGRVFWSPKGTGLRLWCHTLFDLLAACMSDAAWRDSSKPGAGKRDKSNYFAPLASLYSYWCFRLSEGGEDRPAIIGPAMTAITCLDDIVLLGCSIPTVPGNVASVGGKELIQKSRFLDLAGRGRQEGSKKQVLDLNKIESVAHNYGNCAETWAFCLICSQ